MSGMDMELAEHLPRRLVNSHVVPQALAHLAAAVQAFSRGGSSPPAGFAAGFLQVRVRRAG